MFIYKYNVKIYVINKVILPENFILKYTNIGTKELLDKS